MLAKISFRGFLYSLLVGRDDRARHRQRGQVREHAHEPGDGPVQGQNPHLDGDPGHLHEDVRVGVAVGGRQYAV
jgi:hypothetical protein